jgi:mRNA interferase MazF
MFQRGDIIAVPFPFTDLTSAKLRPALIISNTSISDTGDVIIVMITSQFKDTGVNIPITSNDITIPLPKNSFVRCHRVTAIDTNIIQRKVGSANLEFMHKVVEGVLQLIKHDPLPNA